MKIKIILILLLANLLILSGCGKVNEVITDGITGGSTEIFESSSTETETNQPNEANEDGENLSPTGDLNEAPAPIRNDGFVFEYNGVKVYFGENMEVALKQFETVGLSYEYYESQSCNFEGLGKIYNYGSFELSNYRNGLYNYDLMYQVVLYDDSVNTQEGISIGSSFAQMVGAYGEDYITNENIPGQYRYLKGGVYLNFNVKDDVITAIAYQIEDIYS